MAADPEGGQEGERNLARGKHSIYHEPFSGLLRSAKASSRASHESRPNYFPINAPESASGSNIKPVTVQTLWMT
jgi:hypothetical protein